MGVITYDVETPSPIPAGKLFKALVIDSDTLIPKILPQAIKNVEILEGDGGAGTVKIIHFGEGSQYKSVKHRVEAIDKENFTYTYTINEGDVLADVIESITYHIKVVPTEDGGSICKNRSIYNTKGDAVIDEEKIKEGKDKAQHMFKAIEAYITANPDY
ncbi:major allergen Pru ar 1-like [Salvia miltiorrhiza]|uniref:major allergen Pru ar 1-like n=1 Tax=Salvia miltiorrhiza TaxID=226208 RepID=UPI0025AC5F48|nr:major allergen Pru ar 1-like [Salvia miltiorrhiza]